MTSQTPAVAAHAPEAAAAGTNPGSGPRPVADCPTDETQGEGVSCPTVGQSASRITFGFGHSHPLGARCDSCDTTEAHCARDEGCCDECSHFGPQLLRRMPVRCGTERGYHRHRYANTPACLPCRAAHNRHNQRQS